MENGSTPTIRTRGVVSYLKYPGLSRYGRLSHGVFSRHGGASHPPYSSLNTSYSVGDRPERVDRNLSIIKKTIGAKRLIFMNQSHGDVIAVLRIGYLKGAVEVPFADAVITNVPGLALVVKQADCQGVILFDPDNSVVANVHCGWRGNVTDILGKVVTRMVADFGSQAAHLMAAIGPSLGPCCAEFKTHEHLFAGAFDAFMVRKDFFDLWSLSRSQLIEAGVKEENVELAGVCTRCRTDLFYSYRAEGRTGRFATVAMVT